MSRARAAAPSSPKREKPAGRPPALRVAVVSGCARREGIGWAVCRALLRSGEYSVIGIDEQELNFIPDQTELQADAAYFVFVKCNIADAVGLSRSLRSAMCLLDPSYEPKAGKSSSSGTLSSPSAHVCVVVHCAGFAKPTMQEGLEQCMKVEAESQARQRQDDQKRQREGASAADEEQLPILQRLKAFDLFLEGHLRGGFILTEVCKDFFPPLQISNATGLPASAGEMHPHRDFSSDESIDDVGEKLRRAQKAQQPRASAARKEDGAEGNKHVKQLPHAASTTRETEVDVSQDVSIIYVSSTRATQSEPDTEGYAAAKGGLLALTHAQAASFGENANHPRGNRFVRVNCISPGWIDTGGTEKADEGDCVWHSVSRIGRPDDVANAVVFLADANKSGFMTGQELVLDGGVCKRMRY
ncbi:unnamed protein product [Amoebophrya sp. A120]|nr:unnamed protein product [Amoebophrya sp. A120]|eukprot:GSA120T00005733001.1